MECRTWQAEAALRCLRNNLDPAVAERPDDLVVYGGSGKAARDPACLAAIAASLRQLVPDETLLVQSGKPVGVFRTFPHQGTFQTFAALADQRFGGSLTGRTVLTGGPNAGWPTGTSTRSPTTSTPGCAVSVRPPRTGVPARWR